MTQKVLFRFYNTPVIIFVGQEARLDRISKLKCDSSRYTCITRGVYSQLGYFCALQRFVTLHHGLIDCNVCSAVQPGANQHRPNGVPRVGRRIEAAMRDAMRRDSRNAGNLIMFYGFFGIFLT